MRHTSTIRPSVNTVSPFHLGVVTYVTSGGVVKVAARLVKKCLWYRVVSVRTDGKDG